MTIGDGMKQSTFASLAWDGKKRVTRGAVSDGNGCGDFHGIELLGLIQPHYYKGEGGGRPPMPLP